MLGRAGIVPTTTAVAGALELSAPGVPVGPTGQPRGALEIDRAMARLRGDLGRALKKLGASADPRIGAVLDRLALALFDQRLRERLFEAAGGAGGLRAVATDYVRASVRLGGSEERVGELEELCALIGMTLDSRSSARPGAVWVADQIGAVMCVAAVARGAAAIVTSDVASADALAIAGAARLPVVTGVSALFGWIRPGDLLAVDGDTGTVLVQPAPSEIERLRRERRG